MNESAEAEAEAEAETGRLETYTVLAMLGVFSCVGMVGNAVVIYVYTRSRMEQQQTATVFIVSLAVGDFIASSLTMPFTMAFEYTTYQFSDPFTCRFYGLLLTSTIPFSSLVMVGIAIDRYLCICHPFRKLMNVQRAVGMVVLFSVIAGTYGTLGAILYSAQPDNDDPNCNTNNSLPLNQSQLHTAPAHANSNPNSNVTTDFEENMLQVLDANVSLFSNVAVVTSQPCRIVCHEDGAVLFQIYQNFNFGLFMLAVAVVFVLYALIYQSVARQRRRKSRMLGRSTKRPDPDVHVTKTQNGVGVTDTTELSSSGNANGHNGNGNGNGKAGSNLKKKRESLVAPSAMDELQKCRQADERMRNLKTAFMLFIVTIVFVISFMPSIILLIISSANPNTMPPGVLFYMYFLMNAANPVIYCFMNPNFRLSLNALFRHR